ncbi:YhcH/YjgK/YiaL family protein [bacterium]|nr:YhcH/YjgK/YiaL family protein [bacterium]
MIVDNLENAHFYYELNPRFKEVFEFVKAHNLSDFEAGSYKIDGDTLYVNINEYETKEEQKLEAHRKYIDIQIMLEGSEFMGYTNIKNTTSSIPYDEGKDVVFLKGEVDKVLATTQNFFIFFPQDAHKPSLCASHPDKVKKAVFKVKI